MKTARELSLFVENRPGVLAAICRDLAKKSINVEAISVVDHIDHALVRMIVSDARSASHVLEAAGILVIATDVLRIEVDDRPGALQRVAARLARSKVNIQYLYGTSGDGERATLFLRVDDVSAARKALRDV
ncbi:MAG: ACT domain-containing protein [Candidatus Binatia bacterium]